MDNVGLLQSSPNLDPESIAKTLDTEPGIPPTEPPIEPGLNSPSEVDAIPDDAGKSFYIVVVDGEPRVIEAEKGFPRGPFSKDEADAELTKVQGELGTAEPPMSEPAATSPEVVEPTIEPTPGPEITEFNPEAGPKGDPVHHGTPPDEPGLESAGCEGVGCEGMGCCGEDIIKELDEAFGVIKEGDEAIKPPLGQQKKSTAGAHQAGRTPYHQMKLTGESSVFKSQKNLKTMQCND
jgi:hypothetical protein